MHKYIELAAIRFGKNIWFHNGVALMVTPEDGDEIDRIEMTVVLGDSRCEKGGLAAAEMLLTVSQNTKNNYRLLKLKRNNQSQETYIVASFCEYNVVYRQVYENMKECRLTFVFDVNNSKTPAMSDVIIYAPDGTGWLSKLMQHEAKKNKHTKSY